MPDAPGKHPTQFGKAGNSSLVAQAQLELVRPLFNFLDRGLRGFDGKLEGPGLGAVKLGIENILLRALVESRATYGSLCDAQAYERFEAACGDALQSLWLKFKDASREFGSVPPPLLSLTSLALEERIAIQVFGCGPARAPQRKDHLDLAYAMSRFNIRRAEQRIILLTVFSDLLEEASPVPAAMDQIRLAMNQFRSARHMHTFKALAVGSLLGGAALQENRDIVKSMFTGNSASIMEMLEVDGRHPGRYETSVEVEFRKEIANSPPPIQSVTKSKPRKPG